MTLDRFIKTEKESGEKEIDEEVFRRSIIRYILKKYGYLEDHND